MAWRFINSLQSPLTGFNACEVLKIAMPIALNSHLTVTGQRA